jgi:uncharacterized protein
MGIADRLAQCAGFDWDEGNLPKLLERHKVSASEFEQMFFNAPLVAVSDEKHSDREERFFALGHTDAGRPLFVVFTLRNNLIRAISARNMNRKERREYERL